MRNYVKLVGDLATLHGRLLEPWRAILAVARWLEEEHGQTGLFDRMNGLSVEYQRERADLEANDPTRVLILALHEMVAAAGTESLTFAPGHLADHMQRVALSEDLVELGQTFMSPPAAGKLLSSLRFQKAQRTSRKKRWTAKMSDLHRLAESYGVDLPESGTPGTSGSPASEDVPGCHECQGCQAEPEPPSPAPPPAPAAAPPPATPHETEMPSSDGGWHEEF